MTAPVVLSRRQRRLLDLTTRFGPVAVVVGITAFSVTTSLAITTVSLLTAPVTRSLVVWSLVTATVVPLLVAPLCSAVIVRLTTALAGAVEGLHLLATTDPLTGLANRRRFFAVAEERLGAASAAPVLVAMIDVDHFKQVNDEHGHLAGDEALASLATSLRAVVGSSGIVARLGGDEFVLLADADDATLPALTTAIEVCARSIITRRGLPLSASVGMRIVEPGTPVDEALRLADVALYEAKGRRAHGAAR